MSLVSITFMASIKDIMAIMAIMVDHNIKKTYQLFKVIIIIIIMNFIVKNLVIKAC